MSGKDYPDGHHDLRNMIKEAMESGLRDVAAYSKIARAMKDPKLRNLVLSMMADEYGHVRTWYALYHMYQCMNGYHDGNEATVEEKSYPEHPYWDGNYPDWGNRPPHWGERPPYGHPPYEYGEPPYWGGHPPCGGKEPSHWNDYYNYPPGYGQEPSYWDGYPPCDKKEPSHDDDYPYGDSEGEENYPDYPHKYKEKND